MTKYKLVKKGTWTHKIVPKPTPKLDGKKSKYLVKK